MNLLGEAKGFIDAAVDALSEEGGVIHYYEFTSRQGQTEDLVNTFRSAVESQGPPLNET